MSVPAQGLHASVLDALGLRIVSGSLGPGQVVTLDGICADHGVSRVVAREAIRVLESMGLVTSRRRVGIRVQPRDEWNVFDPRVIRWRLVGPDRVEQLLSLSELRRGLEPMAATLAAQRATPQQSADMASAVSDMVVHGRTGDLEAYLQADCRFHATVLAASGNEMLRAMADVVAEVLTGRTHHGLMPSDPNPEAIALHDEVARAVRDQDPERAGAAMRRIIDEASDAMRDELSQ